MFEKHTYWHHSNQCFARTHTFHLSSVIYHQYRSSTQPWKSLGVCDIIQLWTARLFWQPWKTGTILRQRSAYFFFLERNGQKHNYVQRRIQSFQSDLFGLYVVYFAVMRLCLYFSIRDIYQSFHVNDFKQNDKFIYMYFSKDCFSK